MIKNLSLDIDDYKKNKNLYRIENIVWNAKTKKFEQNNQTIEKEIIKITDLSNDKKKKEDVLKLITDWKKQITNIKVKSYLSIENSIIQYQAMAEEILNCINKNTKNSYLCITKTQDNNYHSISAFDLKGISEKNIYIIATLCYPESQSTQETRKHGTFGACGHNNKIILIKYAFEEANIDYIRTYPMNQNLQKPLEKLGFKRF